MDPNHKKDDQDMELDLFLHISIMIISYFFLNSKYLNSISIILASNMSLLIPSFISLKINGYIKYKRIISYIAIFFGGVYISIGIFDMLDKLLY